MKKLLISLLCIIAVVSLIGGSAFSTNAATINFEFKLSQPGWGTEKDGIIARFPNSYPGYHTPWSEPGGHPNLDFEKGLYCWSTTEETLKPDDYVDVLQEDNGNHYITFTATNTYDGIESIPFVESRIDENDEICVVFKWKGNDPNFQVYCNQYRYKSTDGQERDVHRVSHNGDAKRGEIIVDGEDGWNVGYCKPEKDSIRKPYDIMPYYIFNIGVQVQGDPSCNAMVDDIRLAKYNDTNACLYDLDGKLMYDMRNIEAVEGEDLLNEGMFPDINYDITYDDVYGAKKSSTNNSTISENNIFFKDGAPTVVFWVIIICGAAILVAGIAVIVLIIVKKKKAPAEATDESEVSEEAATEDETPAENPTED